MESEMNFRDDVCSGCKKSLKNCDSHIIKNEEGKKESEWCDICFEEILKRKTK